MTHYFGTDGIRGRTGESPITPEFMLKLGWAVGQTLAHSGGGKVVIGKDTRISGYMLESALEAGLSAAGVDIELVGPMPTPAIAYLTSTLRAHAGIMISASHNPYYDNGIKFFSAEGTKLNDTLESAIEAQLEQPMTTVASKHLGKATRINDAPGRYIEFCKRTIPPHVRLNGLKIVVDCANGATYHIAPNVFRELGADVIEMNVTPNGLNINEKCGSTDTHLLQQKVLAERADLGIALDGDGDRLMMVDHKAEVLDGDPLLFIIARDAQQRGTLKGGVVGTVMTNLGFEQALAQLDIPFIRTQVGDRYVLEQLHNRGWLLGGEPSGHIVHLDKNTTGDGIIAALQVLRALLQSGQDLHTLKAGCNMLPQIMINLPFDSQDSAQHTATHPATQEALHTAEERLGQTGRIVLRASGTEPLLRLMIEGEDAQSIETIATQLADTIRSA